jgi:hypothetical protein
MPYRLLIIFSASSAEIGENRLKVFPSCKRIFLDKKILGHHAHF